MLFFMRLKESKQRDRQHLASAETEHTIFSFVYIWFTFHWLVYRVVWQELLNSCVVKQYLSKALKYLPQAWFMKLFLP